MALGSGKIAPTTERPDAWREAATRGAWQSRGACGARGTVLVTLDGPCAPCSVVTPRWASSRCTHGPLRTGSEHTDPRCQVFNGTWVHGLPAVPFVARRGVGPVFARACALAQAEVLQFRVRAKCESPNVRLGRNDSLPVQSDQVKPGPTDLIEFALEMTSLYVRAVWSKPFVLLFLASALGLPGCRDVQLDCEIHPPTLKRSIQQDEKDR